MTNRAVRSAVAVALTLLWLLLLVSTLSLAGVGYDTAVTASALPGFASGLLIGWCVEMRYGRKG